MKKILCFFGACVLSTNLVVASPLISLGTNNGASIYFDGFASTAYSSNITLASQDELDDFIFTVSPGLELILGEGQTIYTASLEARNNITRYLDNDEFDAENWNINGNLSYQSERLRASAGAFFRERQENDSLIREERTLVKIEEFGGNVNGRYTLSPRTAIASGFSYRNVEFDRGTNRDREIYTVPVTAFYEVTQRIDATAGFRYRETEVTGSEDSTDLFYNVGLTGEVTPRLSTELSVGLQERSFSGDRSSRSTLGLESRSSFAATDKSIFRLRLNRDFETAGQGDSVLSTGGELVYVFLYDPFLNFQASAAYRELDYQNRARKDDNYRVGGSANYSFAEYYTVTGSYRYRVNDSNFGLAEYTDHTVTLALRMRY